MANSNRRRHLQRIDRRLSRHTFFHRVRLVFERAVSGHGSYFLSFAPLGRSHALGTQQELKKKIMVIVDSKLKDQLAYSDLLIKNLVEFGKKHDKFELFDKSEEEQAVAMRKLAKRIHGLLAYFSYASQIIKSTINDGNAIQQARINAKGHKNKSSLANLAKSGELYVCFGYNKTDKVIIEWIQSQLSTNHIEFVDEERLFHSKTADTDLQMRVVQSAWVYVLVVSESIFQSSVIQQHLQWIEEANSVHLLLLYYPDDQDYLKLFPSHLFSQQQLDRISNLFSFCISDAPFVSQVFHCLNLLRKQTLLDRQIALLTNRIEKSKQQTTQFEEQLRILGAKSQPSTLAFSKAVLV